MVLLRSMQKQTFVVFCQGVWFLRERDFAFIPKTYTLNNKHFAKMEIKSNSFTQNARKVSFFVCVSLCRSLFSLSLLKSLRALEAHF
jgi:hypothetical protein